VITLDGAGIDLEDVHRTPAGTLLITAQGPGGDMDVFVFRSTDGGLSWQRENLGRVDRDTAHPRLWQLDEGTLALAARETWSPKDAYLRLSTDDGASFGQWIPVTGNPPDAVNAQGQPSVARSPAGAWVAVYSRDFGVYARRAQALESWREAPEQVVYDQERRRYPVLHASGARLLLALTDWDRAIEIYESTDDGRSFAVLSAVRTDPNVSPRRFYQGAPSPGGLPGPLYLCAVKNSQTGDNGSAILYRSPDGGQSWDAGTVYLEGLVHHTFPACHVDETGVYFAVQDGDSGEIQLIVPGAPTVCGDGRRDPGETCDGTDFGPRTCLDLGYGGGELACSADCQALDDAGCLPPDHPPSCAFIDVPVDRQHVIDADGLGPMPPFEVYCADMTSAEPQTYLSLVTTEAQRPATDPGAGIPRRPSATSPSPTEAA